MFVGNCLSYENHGYLMKFVDAGLITKLSDLLDEECTQIVVQVCCILSNLVASTDPTLAEKQINLFISQAPLMNLLEKACYSPVASIQKECLYIFCNLVNLGTNTQIKTIWEFAENPVQENLDGLGASETDNLKTENLLVKSLVVGV